MLEIKSTSFYEQPKKLISQKNIEIGDLLQ